MKNPTISTEVQVNQMVAIRLVYSRIDREYQVFVDIPTAQIKYKRSNVAAYLIPGILGFEDYQEMDENTMKPVHKYYRTMDDKVMQKLISLQEDNECIHVDPIIHEILKAAREQRVSSYQTDAKFEIPANVRGWTLRPYQRAGSRFISNMMIQADKDGVHMYPLIGDEMGLGKTAQVLGSVLGNKEIQTILYVCPNTLKYNVQREMYTWLNTVDSINNQGDRRFVCPSHSTISGWRIRPNLVTVVESKMKKIPGSQILIINYDLLKQPRILKILKERFFDLVVLDEAHLIKNPKSARSKAIFELNSRYRTAMTGTVVSKEPLDAWNLLRWLYPSRFGDRLAFKREFPNTKAGRQRLNQCLRDTVLLRRSKGEVGKLPPYIRTGIYLQADKQTENLINEMNRMAGGSIAECLTEMKAKEAEMKIEAEAARGKPNERELLNKLRKRFYDDCQKLEFLGKIPFEEMARARRDLGISKIPHAIDYIKNMLHEHDKMVLGYHHRKVGDAIQEAFPDLVARVDGSTKDKMAVVDTFTDGDKRIFLGSIKACNFGLNLQVASHLAHIEMTWKAEDLEQFEARIHRLGSKTTCTSHALIYMNSLDERIYELISTKAYISEEILR